MYNKEFEIYDAAGLMMHTLSKTYKFVMQHKNCV
jgi:hypothetical protein